MIDERAEYARLSALVELRLLELRALLDRHEKSRRWGEHEVLDRVERGLGDLVSVIAENKTAPTPPLH